MPSTEPLEFDLEGFNYSAYTDTVGVFSQGLLLGYVSSILHSLYMYKETDAQITTRIVKAEIGYGLLSPCSLFGHLLDGISFIFHLLLSCMSHVMLVSCFLEFLLKSANPRFFTYVGIYCESTRAISLHS